jgi:hypothetical protein
MLVRFVALIGLAFLSGVGMPAAALAQGTRPEASDDPPVEAWALTGVDAGLHDRWRVLVAVGSLGGLDANIVLTEATFIAAPAVQFLGGYVYVNPTAPGVPRLSVLRAGNVWWPMRGRFTIDNRLFIERRSSALAGVSTRGRDRLRFSWAPDRTKPFRLFGSAEALVLNDRGFVEARYQAGVARPARRTTLELYWLHRRSRIRSDFHAIGVTAYLRIGPG